MNKKEQYQKGIINKVGRLYFYLSRGTSVLNELKYYILALWGAYVTFKITDPSTLIIGVIASLILVTITGYIMVHRISKVTEWLNVKHGSHYAIKNFEYTKKTYEILKKIEKKLK